MYKSSTVRFSSRPGGYKGSIDRKEKMLFRGKMYTDSFKLRFFQCPENCKTLMKSFDFRRDASRYPNRIIRNQRKNQISFERVKTTGICCWQVCDRSGDCETFWPIEERRPKTRFISQILIVPKFNCY